MIRFALSRSREFLADAGSVELTKNPDAMIMALRKIEGRGELHGATSAVMEMCVDNPREEFTDLFSTHPSIDRRIKALVDVMGGHDPGPLALPGLEEAQPDMLPGSITDTPDRPAQTGGPPGGPWGDHQAETPQQKPFLPDRPPIDLGAPPGSPSGDKPGGPWGKPSA